MQCHLFPQSTYAPGASARAPAKSISYSQLAAREDDILHDLEGEYTHAAYPQNLTQDVYIDVSEPVVAGMNVAEFSGLMKALSPGPTGSAQAARALHHWTADRRRLERLNEHRARKYDKKLENAIVANFRSAFREQIRMFNSLDIMLRSNKFILVYESAGTGVMKFQVPDTRMLRRFGTVMMLTTEYAESNRENAWIHKIWHVLSVVFPRIEKLLLAHDATGTRYLPMGEIMSLGSAEGVKELVLHANVLPGRMKLLEKSRLAQSLETLYLEGAQLNDLDVAAISTFGIRSLRFRENTLNPSRNALAKLLEQRSIVQTLEKLRIDVVVPAAISNRICEAVAELASLRELNIVAENVACTNQLSLILRDTVVSRTLTSLHFEFASVPTSELDALRNTSLETLSIYGHYFTPEHLSALSVLPVASSVKRLELGKMDVSRFSHSLSRFKKLEWLRLVHCTTSDGWNTHPVLSFAENGMLTGLEVAGRYMFMWFEESVAAKKNLEELVLEITELSGREIAIVLGDKHALRSLSVIGGRVTEETISAILKLESLERLVLRYVDTSYETLMLLLDNKEFMERLGEGFEFYTVLFLTDEQNGTLLSHGFTYSDGFIVK